MRIRALHTALQALVGPYLTQAITPLRGYMKPFLYTWAQTLFSTYIANMTRIRQICQAFLLNSDTGYTKLICEKRDAHFEHKVEKDKIIVKPMQ